MTTTSDRTAAERDPGAAAPDAGPPRPGHAPASPEPGGRWPAVVWAAPAGLFAVLLGLVALCWWLDYQATRRQARRALVEAMGPAGRDAPLHVPPHAHLGVWLEGVTAAGLAAGLFAVLRRREAERRVAAERMRVLEELNRVAAGLAGNRQPAGGGGVVVGAAAGNDAGGGGRLASDHHDRLADLCAAARRLLDMDGSCVTLYDPAGDRLEVLAWAGDPTNATGPRYIGLADLPACRAALDQGEVTVIGDVASATGPVNRQMVARHGVAAVAIIPLQVEQERIGILVLYNNRPRTFDPAARQLARVLGAHASLILAHARLYAGMAAALAAQRRLADQRARLAEQRDALWAVSTAAFGAATLAESLRGIVNQVPEALGVHSCSVALTTDRPDELELVATTGRPAAELVAGPFRVAGLHAGDVLRTGRAVTVGDARADRRVSQWTRYGLPCGSVAFLPLVRRATAPVPGGDGPGPPPGVARAAAGPAVFGIMGLVRERVGPFDPDQLRLAEVFADRAAAAIEHARLREQTDQLLARTRDLLAQASRDRDARTLLLRELHHRVKNNLAGIAGLLAARPPGVAAADTPAGRWVDRIADRVHTMAAAHDLFVGGTGSARLGDVVRRVVDALPIGAEGKPVVVRADLGDAVGVTLLNEQVVGLSMALHELCFNALVHGLPGGGVLRVSATLVWEGDGDTDHGDAHRAPAGERRLGVGRTLVLEVADDGRGLPKAGGDEDLFGPVPAANPTAGSGLGLTLVEGLVRRELRGTFELEPRAPGGTTARLTIPLDGGGAGTAGTGMAGVGTTTKETPPGPTAAGGEPR